MLESIISSKTRVKLLVKFFLNEDSRGYLRGLSTEFGESSNAIRVELNRLVEAGLLSCETKGNKRMYRANRQHPLYANLHQLVRTHIGIDRVVDAVVAQLGDLERVYLAGSFSQGVDRGVIDLLFVGSLNRQYLVQIVDKAEQLIQRKVRYVVYSRGEVGNGALESFDPKPMLLYDHESLKAS